MSVYLDHAATSPMLPAARETWAEALDLVGNPSSIHAAGARARRMLEESRERIAASLGCEPIEVVLTSGGTEAINLAIKGMYWAARARDPGRRRILVARGEHHATIDTVEWLEQHEDALLEWIPLDRHGRIRLDALEAALQSYSDSALVTVLWANNEVGTLQPIPEIAALAARHQVPVHADAVAAYRRVPVDFRATGLAALSVSAHKIGGPLGAGALVLSRSTPVVPLIHGGGQQRQVRSGTQDAPAARAFAVAAEHPAVDLTALRDRLIEGVRTAVPSAILRGHPRDRLDNNAHFTFPGCEGDSLLYLLDAAGVCVSTGSACQAGIPEASHVLLGMGLGEQEARGALRFTLGHTSTDTDIQALLAALPAAVEKAQKAGYATRQVGR